MMGLQRSRLFRSPAPSSGNSWPSKLPWPPPEKIIHPGVLKRKKGFAGGSSLVGSAARSRFRGILVTNEKMRVNPLRVWEVNGPQCHARLRPSYGYEAIRGYRIRDANLPKI
jgi:hypothetical protein